MDDETRADLMFGIEELQEARPGYDQAQTYYDGKVPEVFTNARLRRALAAHRIDFDLNFAKTPVNAVTDRLEIAGITGGDDDQTALISKIWQDNQLDLEMPDLFRRAGEYGDAYLMVLPVDDDRGNTVRVEMYYNSPQTVRVIYDEENPRRKAFTIKRWAEGKHQRAELYYDDHIERWTTGENSTGDNPRDWQPWPADPEDPESWSSEHDWGEQPVFHFRNDRPYGVPEHYGAYGPQNAITKLQATHMGTVDYQGAPQRYALTETSTTDTSDLEPGDFDDGDWPADENGLGPSDSGDDSSLKAGPGEMWLLRGYKAVGQFDAANPQVFLDPILFNVRAMAQICTTPLHLFDPSGEQPSGQSVRAQDAPFTKKVGNRQLSYGATLREALAFALRRLGVENPVVTVHWKPAATVDDVEGWQTVKAKIEAGVPRRQALIEAGYRAEQVDAWLTGVDDAELQRRVDILASLADSAQKLGAAATLGVLSNEQAQGLLAGALSDLEVLAGAQEST
ncbi:phage portal protein [Streptomyces longwoodensis]|uniref:phage portal protein n=1 Tax=Streptomyces longwoodensis TaxID=68231 RepID=UPI002DDB26E7|nr:phage portal protein [Streptomyces longwoodensis]WRY87392.1 phage portal protein [Streptomyces longwoodensis]